MTEPSCELCISTGGELVWENALCRVVSIADPNYPGFCRVILNRHELEMTDLEKDEQQEMMRVVFAVEAALRRLLNPYKINLASLGNRTPPRSLACHPALAWGSLFSRSDMGFGAKDDHLNTRDYRIRPA